MRRATILDNLRQLAALVEIRGSAELTPLRSVAAALARLTPEELAEFEGHVRAGAPLPGVPPGILRYVRDSCSDRADSMLQSMWDSIPFLFRRLRELRAITANEAAVLCRELSILTPDDLDAALGDGRIDRLPASDRIAAAGRIAIDDAPRVTLGRAMDVLESLQALIASLCPSVTDSTVAGDARRFEPLVTALVLVVCASDASSIIDTLERLPEIAVRHRSNRRAVLWIHHAEVDLRVVPADEYGTALFTATGSQSHVREVSRRLRRPALSASEEEVYANAGLPWIAPELRNDEGEIEAASQQRLPSLVTRADIRGDLHMHSVYSDGQDTIEAMVRAAIALGYAYVAITDHSESAAASRTVTIGQLAIQREEIERLRESYPQITILHGIEAEILPDGRLDFPDSVLERLDIVLASLHDPARQDDAELTLRCLRVIDHPLVNIITHPANRLVGRRDGYALDYERIYAAAAESGTALEIDGAPGHLDLDGAHARAAVAMGATVAIDSDSHRARVLDRQMAMGVGTARRGWVEPQNVLNCRSLAEVRAFVAAKRQRRTRVLR